MTVRTSTWFEERTGSATRGPDLVVFPYAGGNPASFRNWTPDALGCRTLVACLPGRGQRFDESPMSDFEAVLDQLVLELEEFRAHGLVLFGHSLGAYQAFEVARRLTEPPLAVVVSGADEPSSRSPGRHRNTMTDGELVGELRRLGGTPIEVLENAELLEFLMPTIRADFGLVDSYRFVPGAALPCPIHVLAGRSDATTSERGIAGWQHHTRHETKVARFPGDHFFVHGREAAVIEYVRSVVPQQI